MTAKINTSDQVGFKGRLVGAFVPRVRLASQVLLQRSQSPHP